jgi:hypothetical protein
LLPGRNQLQAALLVDVPAEGRLSDDWAFWQTLTGDQLRLRIGDIHFPSTLVTCRPEDRCIGAAHWVQFALGADARCLLANFRKPALFEVVHEAYRNDSAPLSEDIRQSLLDDLVLSDRDEPAAPATAGS